MCFTGAHIPLFFVAVLSLFVYGLGVPAAATCVVILNRNNVIRSGFKSFKKAFGFLTDGFRQDSVVALCWDSVVLMRRFFIATFTVIFEIDAYMQGKVCHTYHFDALASAHLCFTI